MVFGMITSFFCRYNSHVQSYFVCMLLLKYASHGVLLRFFNQLLKTLNMCLLCRYKLVLFSWCDLKSAHYIYVAHFFNFILMAVKLSAQTCHHRYTHIVYNFSIYINKNCLTSFKIWVFTVLL